MSRVLVISDTHLKSWMFDKASVIIEKEKVDYAIQLGDNFDDFYSVEEDYRNHNKKMLWFARKFPNTIWLWGNHEASYVLNRRVTGTIIGGNKYVGLYSKWANPKNIHIDNNVVFSHAGIVDEFLCDVNMNNGNLEKINSLNLNELLVDHSPLWVRTQFKSYHSNIGYTQVVGHTPQEKVIKDKNIIYTDVFSTD